MVDELVQAESILIWAFVITYIWGFLAYFVFTGKNVNKSAALATSGIIALFFVCCGFLINWLSARIGISMFTLIILAIIMGGLIIRDIYRAKPDSKGILLFIVYLVILMYITFFSRMDGSLDYQIKLSITDMFTEFMTVKRLSHFVLNTVMFIPVGFFFTLLKPSRYKSIRFGFVGLYLSLLIETTQLLSKHGECDIADLISNTLGMILGILVYKVISTITKKDVQF